MVSKPIKKLYYSISEVSEITEIKPYVLRYWETEFPNLKPAKNRAGNRIYREKDIKLIHRIKQLLYDEKFTIDGARKKIKETESGSPAAPTSQIPIRFNPNEAGEIIREIRRELEGLQQILNSGKNDYFNEGKSTEK